MIRFIIAVSRQKFAENRFQVLYMYHSAFLDHAFVLSQPCLDLFLWALHGRAFHTHHMSMSTSLLTTLPRVASAPHPLRSASEPRLAYSVSADHHERFASAFTAGPGEAVALASLQAQVKRRRRKLAAARAAALAAAAATARQRRAPALEPPSMRMVQQRDSRTALRETRLASLARDDPRSERRTHAKLRSFELSQRASELARHCETRGGAGKSELLRPEEKAALLEIYDMMPKHFDTADVRVLLPKSYRKLRTPPSCARPLHIKPLLCSCCV